MKSTEVNFNYDSKTIERLPLPRTYQGLFQLTPGIAAATGFAPVAGGGRQENEPGCSSSKPGRIKGRQIKAGEVQEEQDLDAEGGKQPERPRLAGIATGAAALDTIAGVFVSPGPQSPPSRNTVRLEPRRATRRGGDRTPAPVWHAPASPPLAGACARNLPVIWRMPAVGAVPSLML